MTQNPLYVKGVNTDLNSDKFSMCNHSIAHQVPLSMRLSQEEYQSELSFPAPEDLPDLGIEPSSLASSILLSHLENTSLNVQTKQKLMLYNSSALPWWLRW